MRMVNVQLLDIDAAELFRRHQREAERKIAICLKYKANHELDPIEIDEALRECTVCQSIMRAMNRGLSRKALIAAMHAQKTFF